MTLLKHYGLPPETLDLRAQLGIPREEGFFRFGANAICWGKAAATTRTHVNGNLSDVSGSVTANGNQVTLPFDVDQVIDNLRFERYAGAAHRWMDTNWVMATYYRLRPYLPVSLRKHLQRLYLRDWETQTFPAWPVDRSVDILLERLLMVAMQTSGRTRIPFIWFWPRGYRACAILTHDIETQAGRDLTPKLMDLDDSYGFKSAFQIVPEKRYTVTQDFLEQIRSRDFEINVHGLDHEGNLFDDRTAFLERARKINQYGQQFGARGFRSPALYRNVDWLQDLQFDYDMSIPNVARLEAQRGGCCTTMPYFLPGGMLELPLTMAEDYTLFHILNDYSTDLWKQQMDLILRGNGLISLIVHPDYVFTPRAERVYRELLEEVDRLRSTEGLWTTLPGAVNKWWRQRHSMQLVRQGNAWKIEGQGSEEAVIAFACFDGQRLTYEISEE